MPNPRAQSPLTLDKAVSDIKSFAQPAQAMGDMLASTLRGSVAGTAGLPGDIRELIDLFGPEAVERVLGKRVMPTTEEMNKMLPPAVPTNAPASRQHTADIYGSIGEFLPTPGAGTLTKAASYGLGRAAGTSLRGGAEAINNAHVYGQGSLAAVTPQPMRMAMPDNLQRMREEIRAKSEQDKALQDAYNKSNRHKPLNEWPTLEEFKATNVQPTQPELDQMRLDLDEQHFGKGGAAKEGVEGLLKLVRAPAKSKEEIEAIAQRIAPQMTGEYVRGKKGAKTVAGKTQKQFEREKTLEHDIRPTAGERPPVNPVDIESLKGNVMMGISGDPTITGQTVHGVAGRGLRSPAPQHGGPLYGLGHGNDSFWASNLSAAQGVQNRARELGELYQMPVVGNYVKMGPDSYSYAQHFADANLQNIRPEEMTKAQIEGFNKLVRKGSAKSGPRPSWPGIENPDEAYLHMAVDPELRKHFGNLMQMPTVTEKFGLPSGVDVAHAVTEPDLRNMEIGVTGKSMGLMRPDVSDLKLSEHPTYSHDIPGQFIGGLKYPTPYELTFPDTLKSVRETPKQAQQEFGSFKMVGPSQIIDPQLIDEIKQYEEFIKKYTGKKKGGEVHMADGGITGDDLILEERPL
jgi:hypothetical protein